jgi:hypothetical protein
MILPILYLGSDAIILSLASGFSVVNICLVIFKMIK